MLYVGGFGYVGLVLGLRVHLLSFGFDVVLYHRSFATFLSSTLVPFLFWALLMKTD